MERDGVNATSGETTSGVAGEVRGKPRVSVVIPHWNGADLLHRAVTSVPDELVLEVIVSDDGSTEGVEVLDRLETLGIRVLRHPTQTGEANARNRGLAAAQGEVIFFLDADDRACAKGLEAAVERFRADRSTDFVVGSWIIEGTGELHRVPAWEPWRLRFMNRWPACFVARRSTLMSIGGFPDVRAYADWALWLRVVETGLDVVTIPEPLFEYRVSTSGLLSRSGRRFGEHYQALRASAPAYFADPPKPSGITQAFVARAALAGYHVPFALPAVARLRAIRRR